MGERASLEAKRWAGSGYVVWANGPRAEGGGGVTSFLGGDSPWSWVSGLRWASATPRHVQVTVTGTHDKFTSSDFLVLLSP